MAATDVEQQQLLIGGEWTGASGGGTFERSDPFTGEPVTVAAAAGAADANAACDAAAAAFAAWSSTPPGERRTLLNKAADVLMERAPEIAGIMTEEVGGTFGWGMFNCDLASRMLREAAAQAYSVTGEVIPSDVPGSLAMGVRVPAGVVVGMAPWNAPVILSARAVAMPLAFGNTVVLKASEHCPRTHAAVARAIADAGVPAGRDQPRHPRAAGRPGGRRRADRAPGRAAGELHGLDARRANRRGEVRRAPQAVPARAGRQGAAGRAARRRPGGCRGRRELRRVHELRARSACRPRGSSPTARSPDELGAKLAERAGSAHHGRPARPGHDARARRQRRARASAWSS